MDRTDKSCTRTVHAHNRPQEAPGEGPDKDVRLLMDQDQYTRTIEGIDTIEQLFEEVSLSYFHTAVCASEKISLLYPLSQAGLSFPHVHKVTPASIHIHARHIRFGKMNASVTVNGRRLAILNPA